VKSADEKKFAEIFGRVAPQFLAEGHKKVYVATCCGRVLITLKEPEKCGTCGEKPEGQWTPLSRSV
jgi:rubrerythrin